MECEKTAPRIIIMDSGVDKGHAKFTGKKIDGISLLPNPESGNCDFTDHIGHGTAVYGIIQQHCPWADILNVRIFDKDRNQMDEDVFMSALEFILANYTCDIINLSLGINMLTRQKELYRICQAFEARGTIIVSAFDNFGSMSYPAAFDNVIGVISHEEIRNSSELIYVESESVNVCAYGEIQRVLWINPLRYSFGGGNSFACAHVTGLIAQFYQRGLTRTHILMKLKEMAEKTIYYPSSARNFRAPDMPPIQKAVLFPFNKEMHSLVRFQHLLPFRIMSVYDSRLSGRVGAKTGQMLKMASPDEIEFCIENIDQLNYSSFDTLIIGHMERFLHLQKNSNLREQLVQRCISEKKLIYSFDSLPFESKQIYTPSLNEHDVQSPPFGLLYRCPVPVLGVFGTTSRQGKFSLQLYLRELFLRRGYDIGQIGTEPSSKLFGMDFCFHYGYEAHQKVIRQNMVCYINACMKHMSDQNKELIIVGGQSKTICYDNGNVSNFAFSQYEFLMSVSPDAVILCVNPFDQANDIIRTIHFIEAAVDCTVLALVLFPMDLRDPDAGIYSDKIPMSPEMLEDTRISFSARFDRPVYVLGELCDMEKLVQLCIDFF